MSDVVEVWLDPGVFEKGVLGTALLIGLLSTDNRQIRFAYDKAWLKHRSVFPIDPDLSLDTAPFYPKASTGTCAITVSSCRGKAGAWRRHSTSTPTSTRCSMSA